jgi:PAS domain S-box-containing protein
VVAAKEAVIAAPSDRLTISESDSIRLLLEAVPAGLWVTDRDLVNTWVSEGMELQAVNMRAEDFVGHSVVELGLGEDAVAAHRRALRGESVAYDAEWAGRTFDCRVEPFRDVDGAILGVIGVALDITERRSAEERLQWSLEERRQLSGERVRLLRYLVHAQEDERRRIAEGLHDDSIQHVSALGLRLATLARRAGDPELSRRLEGLIDDVDGVVTRLRSMLFELAPPTLRSTGLGPGLHEMLERSESEPGAPAEWSVVDELDSEPDEDTRVLLYRMAQEVFHNVRKHAGASRLGVLLEDRDGGILVRISDDGIGFIAEGPVSPPGHLGLQALREHAEMAGGWCRIESGPDRGTTVLFWVPRRDPAVIPEA